MTTSEYLVSGMSCGHCEAAILGEVNQIPGVRGVDMSAGTGRMVITSSAPIDEEEAAAGTEGAGDAAVIGGVGDVAARAAGHQDLHARLAIFLQQQDVLAALGSVDGGH